MGTRESNKVFNSAEMDEHVSKITHELHPILTGIVDRMKDVPAEERASIMLAALLHINGSFAGYIVTNSDADPQLLFEYMVGQLMTSYHAAFCGCDEMEERIAAIAKQERHFH